MLTHGIEGGLAQMQALGAESISKAVTSETAHFLMQSPWLIAGLIFIGAALKITDVATDSGIQRLFSRRFAAAPTPTE